MKLWMVIYSYFDDYFIFGVATSEESAKQIKRDGVENKRFRSSHPGTHKDTLFKRTEIFEIEADKMEYIS